MFPLSSSNLPQHHLLLFLFFFYRLFLLLIMFLFFLPLFLLRRLFLLLFTSSSSSSYTSTFYCFTSLFLLFVFFVVCFFSFILLLLFPFHLFIFILSSCLNSFHVFFSFLIMSAEVKDVCQANPNMVFPDDQNCAKYIDCSARTSQLGNYVMECKYPQLFSTKTGKCENFETVQCDKRVEPQAPCKWYFIQKDFNKNYLYAKYI